MHDRDLEDLLDQLPAHQSPAPAHLRGRIMAHLPQHEEDPLALLRHWLIGSAWRGLGTVAMPLLIGFALGYSQITSDPYEVDGMLFTQTSDVYEVGEATP
ncbi:MAG: hypothetical protein AAF513_01485 [Pseudomonadota bacterium]